jgi:uncharacterized membrane protein
MKTRKISIGIMSVLLMISITNYLRITNGNVRNVEFISILAIGAISGLLISQIISLFKNE